MKNKIIMLLLFSLSFIFASSGMFYGHGSYVGGAYHSDENTDSDGDDFTTTSYGASAGFFVNPNVEVYIEGSLYDDIYADSYYSDYNRNGTQFLLGGAYHYRNALDMDGNSLNLRFGAEYSTITIDGEWLGDIEASGTDTALNIGGYFKTQLAGFNVIPFIVSSSKEDESLESNNLMTSTTSR